MFLSAKVIYFLITEDDGVEQKEGRSERSQKGLPQTFLPPPRPRDGGGGLWEEEQELKAGGLPEPPAGGLEIWVLRSVLSFT